MDLAVSRELIKKIPKKKAQVLERIMDMATTVQLCGSPSPKRRKIRNALDQDPGFFAILHAI